MGGQGQVGVCILELSHPGHAAEIGKQIDDLFKNSSAATRTSRCSG